MLLKFIFFFFALIAILYEVWCITNCRRLSRFAQELKSLKKNDGKVQVNSKHSAFIICQFLYCGWALVGLFSSQWIVFLVLITLGMTSFLSFSKKPAFIVLDSIITLGSLVFAILNAFHLHIPLWSRFLDYCL